MRFALFKFYLTFSVLICLSGCIAESSFKLSDQSRLPKWFELPEGKKRSDFSVTLHYYVKPDGREARLVFKQDDRWLSSETVVGKLSGLKPLHLEKASADDNHEYEIITANGITDIIGHKGKNDLFFMVDDPAVWSELGVEKVYSGSE